MKALQFLLTAALLLAALAVEATPPESFRFHGCGNIAGAWPKEPHPLDWERLQRTAKGAVTEGLARGLDARELERAALSAIRNAWRAALPRGAETRDDVGRLETAFNALVADPAVGSWGTDRPSPTATGNEVPGAELFKGTAYVITFPCPPSPDKQDLVVLANIYAAEAVLSFQKSVARPKLERAAAEIGRLDKNYTAYLRDGLPMWPWEAWINGLGMDVERDIGKPVPGQWVFLRPGAGMETNMASRDKADAKLGLGIEPIGYVWYVDSGAGRYTRYHGVSLLTTLRSEPGVGYGILYRYGQYNLGIVRHYGQERDTALFIGIDLHRYLGDRSLTDAALDKAKDKANQAIWNQ
jgi:hypothetical protein